MKRLHVHVAVEDLPASIRFYSQLFAADPIVLKHDYAKWMLEDPRVNFAISSRGASAGIEHLGIQVEDRNELTEVHARLTRAEQPVLEEGETVCCYAKSEKSWIEDPQGVKWETFLTTGESTTYGNDPALGNDPLLSNDPVLGESAAACCVPAAASSKEQAEGPCCTPAEKAHAQDRGAACC